MGSGMELRHLRYFVAVAEEKSITVAATRRLRTAQPSLSRQLRELEAEVGARLMTRSARGIELTAAGRTFLDHARLALAQVEAAGAAARRAAHPEERTLALGFLSGFEPQWLPGVMHVLREELPRIEVTISSKHSPQLAEGLATGQLDAAFLRREERYTIFDGRGSTCSRHTGANISPWRCRSLRQPAAWRCCLIMLGTS
jgi:LysR family hca operon transcriptional activator